MDNTMAEEKEKQAVEEVKEETVGEQDVETRLQQLMVENAKLKKAFDKTASEAAEYKKKYNATLSEKEQADQQKAEKEAEREAKFEELLRENTINRNEKNYLALGYSPDLAAKAAVAQADNDFDELYKLQQEFVSAKLKAQEAEWIRNRPEVFAGGKEEEAEDPFLSGFKSALKHR